MHNLQIWNVITEDYISSKIWLVLTIVALVYLMIQFSKENQKKMILVIVLSIVVILNEFSFSILIKLFDEKSYYRFLWMIPYCMIVAYALFHCVQGVIISTKSRKEKSMGVLLLFAVVLILFVTNGNYIQGIKCAFPQNKYLVTDDILEIRYAIEQEKNSGNCGELPVIACPQVVMLQYQTIDAGCIISTNRDTYLQIREYGEDISSLSQDRKDKYLLSTICEDSAQPEIMEAKAAVEREQIEYMIVRANAGMEQYMENLDFSFVAQTQSYMIYRNNYPWFQMPTNEAEVENRKDAMGLHENEIVMDLGLEKEYTIVTLNDLHVIALDDTVTEPNIQTVKERYDTFVSNTGVKSVDMWNGISTIIDSYQPDGLCFLGDLIDYNSETTANLFADGLERINVPYMYLRADHDLGIWYAEDRLTQEDAFNISIAVAPWEEFFLMEYEEFYILGWNNSTSQLSENGLQLAKDYFDRAQGSQKPIVLMTHVPINSMIDNKLEIQAREFDPQNRAKLWGSQCLYQPEEMTQEFLDMLIADNSPVRAIVSGHLHFPFVIDINENITEYVMAPAYRGEIGIIHIQ